MLENYVKFSDITEEIKTKYESALPSELLTIWKEQGFGSFMNGFFKVINPDEYSEQVKALFPEVDILAPVMITGLGDVVYLNGAGAVGLLKCCYGTHRIIAADISEFLEGLKSENFDPELWDYRSFRSIDRIRGKLNYSQCYYYDPLVRACGYRRVVHLKKIEIKEYFDLLLRQDNSVAYEDRPKRMSREDFLAQKKAYEENVCQNIVIDEDYRGQTEFVYGVFFDERIQEWIIYHTEDRGRTGFEMGCMDEDIAFGMLEHEIEEDLGRIKR